MKMLNISSVDHEAKYLVVRAREEGFEHVIMIINCNSDVSMYPSLIVYTQGPHQLIAKATW